jgi:hypothetical protein
VDIKLRYGKLMSKSGNRTKEKRCIKKHKKVEERIGKRIELESESRKKEKESQSRKRESIREFAGGNLLELPR